MADQLTVDQAVERAMRSQDAKIAAIRNLAEGRQTLADVKEEAARKLAELERQSAEQIGAAERDDLRLYNTAIKAGWSADELRKIGFDQPAKSRRATRQRKQSNVSEARELSDAERAHQLSATELDAHMATRRPPGTPG